MGHRASIHAGLAITRYVCRSCFPRTKAKPADWDARRKDYINGRCRDDADETSPLRRVRGGESRS